MFYEFKGLVSGESQAYSIRECKHYLVKYNYEISGVISSDNIFNDIKVLEENIAQSYKQKECKLNKSLIINERDIEKYWRITNESIELVKAYSRNDSKLDNFMNGLHSDIKNNLEIKTLSEEIID